LAELPHPPSDEQLARIEGLIRLEWSALKAEGDAMVTQGREAREAAREGREHRRLYDRMLSDHVASAAKTARRERAPSLENLLAAGRQ
jgi:hypothetical protein